MATLAEMNAVAKQVSVRLEKEAQEQEQEKAVESVKEKHVKKTTSRKAK